MDGTETEFAQRWGTWLTGQLAAKGWTGAALRRAIESIGGSVGPSQISRWVNGEQRPSLKGARLVADALGVSRSEAFNAAGHSEDIGSAESPPVVVADPAEPFIQMVKERGLHPVLEKRMIARVRADVARWQATEMQSLTEDLDTIEAAIAVPPQDGSAA